MDSIRVGHCHRILGLELPIKGYRLGEALPPPLLLSDCDNDNFKRFLIIEYRSLWQFLPGGVDGEGTPPSTEKLDSYDPILDQALKIKEKEKKRMGFDAKGFGEDIGRDKEGHKGFGPRTPFLSPSDMEDGVFLIRFLPPYPSKCVSGYTRIATHKLETEVNRDMVRFLCLGKGCPSCYYAEKLGEVYQQLNPDYQKLVAELEPSVQYMFPAVVRGIKRTEKVKNKDGKEVEKTIWTPNKEVEEVVIWSIMGFTKALLSTMKDIFSETEDLTDPKRGFYLRFTKKGNKYDLRVIPKPSKLLNEGWEKAYPKTDGMFDRKFKIGEEKMLALLESAWWLKKLTKKYPEIVPGAGDIEEEEDLLDDDNSFMDDDESDALDEEDDIPF